MVLARILSVEDFGRINFILSISSVVAIILTTGLAHASTKYIPKFLSEGDLSSVKSYLSWSFMWMCAMSAVNSIILWIIIYFVSNKDVTNILMGFFITIPPIMFWLWQRFFSLGFDYVGYATVPRDIVYPLASLLGLYLFPMEDFFDVLILLNSILLFSIFIGAGVLLFKVRPVLNGAKTQIKMKNIKEWHTASLSIGVSNILILGMHSWDILILGLLTSMGVVAKCNPPKN
jgi:O-antigen/teichoic acid export membrane protein